MTTTRQEEYRPVVMTQGENPIAVIVDYEAFMLLRTLFDQVQQLRNEGELATPATWRTMCLEMMYGGFTHQEVPA